jgi:hypothetical protein
MNPPWIKLESNVFSVLSVQTVSCGTQSYYQHKRMSGCERMQRLHSKGIAGRPNSGFKRRTGLGAPSSISQENPEIADLFIKARL